ncbi:helix-turn-helix domain-containing protein [Nocardia sp. NPDC058705]|uniref:helix-turn-helix domain-containing protein n=1 Tax=Nocardia sp. NPDC058705 TaxID=3346609 RepID=UPI0036BAC592
MGDVEQARVTLGARLRELRKAANLTGRDLASRAGWHPSKVTRLEQGSKMATENEIRVWCALTDAPAQVPVLIASARNIDAEYQSWRRQTSRKLQQSTGELEANAELIRGYDHQLVPGLLQTPAYARAILTTGIEFIGGSENVDEALAERIKRQQAVRELARASHFILAEQALYTTVGDDQVMAEQLNALADLTDTDGPVTLGVVPRNVKALGRTVDFTIYDSSVVRIETTTASISVTDPDELAFYEKMFRLLVNESVVGEDARARINAAYAGEAAGTP